MKPQHFIIICLSIFLVLANLTQTQAQDTADPAKTYLIIKNDGSRYIGKIISQDAREVIIDTRRLGEIIIPKHEIKEIRELDEEELDKEGDLKPSETFSTRYFITTNGIPLDKGESYIIWNIFGPDIQYGFGDKFGAGIMTTWMGSPIIGSAKYSIPLGKSSSLGIGTLLGTGSWAAADWGIALPFAALTFGSSSKNISFSGGYGLTWTGNQSSDGRALFSVAGMSKLNDKFGLVFDSFIVTGTNNDDGAALLIPGLRLQTDPGKAFQIGFAGVAADGELVPLPLPMLQWFRSF